MSRWRQARKEQTEEVVTTTKEEGLKTEGASPAASAENAWEEVQRLKREYLQLDIVLREPVKATQEEGLDYDPKYPGTVVDMTNSTDIRLKIFGSKRRFSTSVLTTIKRFSTKVQEARTAAVNASTEVKNYLESSQEPTNLKQMLAGLKEKVQIYTQERDSALAELRGIAAGIERGPVPCVPEPSNPDAGCLWFVELVAAFRRQRDIHPSEIVTHLQLLQLFEEQQGLGKGMQESFAGAKSNLTSFLEQNDVIMRKHNILPA